MRDNTRKIRDFFKNPFPHVYGRRKSAVRDAEMLTANLAVRLLLAPVAGYMYVFLLYVPSQQLWSLRDGQFT